MRSCAVDRTACVDIHGLPLQLLLRRHPDWTGRPVVVVDRDKAQGVIHWANEPARVLRIFPGMRYAAGLALSSDLRGGVVAELDIAEAVSAIAQRLWSFSPRIEPCLREPGIFWLDASGLQHVFPCLETWSANIVGDLRAQGYRAIVAVGFSRFGSYAACKASPRSMVFAQVEQERAYLRAAPITRFRFDARVRESLLKLGVKTLGDFIALPAAGIRRRFGAEAEALHALARGDAWSPLNPEALFEPLEYDEVLDWPEDNAERLTTRLACLLEPLLAALQARHEVLKTLRFGLTLMDECVLSEEISPAQPTCDANQIVGLLALRMAALALSAPVTALRLSVEGVAVSEEQLALFQETPIQNIEAAHRALARLRSEFGNDAVVYARSNAGHLPEAQYAWERLERLRAPQPTPGTIRPLVRRFYNPPVELPPRDRNEPDGWLISGIADGPVEETIGPQIVSGGWWLREISRAYYYVRTRSGRWLWIYHDANRRRWFLHGEVQ